MMGIPSDIAHLKMPSPHYSESVSEKLLEYFRTEMQDVCPCWMLVENIGYPERPDSPQPERLDGGSGRTPYKTLRPHSPRS